MKNGRISILVNICFSVFLWVSTPASAQNLVPQLNFRSNWNQHSYAVSDYPYNSLWGWTSISGHEYAIMGSLDSIYFFDVTNPLKIRLCDARAGRYNNCVNREFKTYQNYCYAVADHAGCSLQIFDLSYLPDSVHLVYDNDTLSSAAHSLFIDGDSRLYLTWNKRAYGPKQNPDIPMTVLSIKNPVSPVFLADLVAPIGGNGQPQFEYVHDCFARNDTVYCCCAGAGLYIYNYANPNNPVLLQAITSYNGNQPGYNHSCWLNPAGNLLVFTDETPVPVELFDVSDLQVTPNQPDLRQLCTFGSNTNYGSIGHNAYFKGNYIYMSYYEDGVVIFDASDPTRVHEITSYDTYPQNAPQSYSGLLGCWNIYPYFPSGNIIASDTHNGLFVLGIDSVSAINSNYLNDNFLDIKILNNPIVDNIRLVESSAKSEIVKICLYDMIGKKLFSSEYHFPAGKNHIEIPVIDIQPGAVILSATTDNASFTRKLLKASVH